MASLTGSDNIDDDDDDYDAEDKMGGKIPPLAPLLSLDGSKHSYSM